jgi:hypothetical protein
VLYTRGNVRDCGQSVVQLGGDDRTGVCLGTDMTISACYFGILQNIMHPLQELQLIFTMELGL